MLGCIQKYEKPSLLTFFKQKLFHFNSATFPRITPVKIHEFCHGNRTRLGKCKDLYRCPQNAKTSNSNGCHELFCAEVSIRSPVQLRNRNPKTNRLLLRGLPATNRQTKALTNLSGVSLLKFQILLWDLLHSTFFGAFAESGQRT